MIPLHDDNPTVLRPVVTIGLIAACVLVFLWQQSLSPEEEVRAVYALGLIPGVLFGELALPPVIVMVPAELSIITSMFLHGGWLHLAMNGAAFLGLGHALVRMIGIGRFLVIFAVTAIAGALTFGLIAQTVGPLVGASGAIFGLFAVLTAWQERALRRAGRSRAMIWRRIGGLVALNVALAFGLGGLLAWQAHLGGWVAGWLLAGVFRPRRGPMRAF